MNLPRTGWLAAGAVVVALAGEIAGWLALGVAAGLVGAATMWVAIQGARGRGGGRAITVVAIGALAMAVRLGAGGFEGASSPALPQERGTWQATVELTWAPRDGRQLGRIRVDVPGGRVALLATLPRFPTVVPGDVLSLGGTIRPFGDDERGESLRASGMVGSIRTDEMAIVTLPSGPARLLEGLRRGAGDALAIALPEPAAGLAAGILIGLRDRVDRELAADFTTAGVSHVVAISGWNIAIVAAGVAALGGRLHRRRRTGLIAGAIALYVAFAGASPAVLRAGAMAGVVLVARESARPARAATALGCAVLGLLLLDPGLVVDAGFQLSSAATAGLIAWATPLAARLGGAKPGRVRAWFAESLGVSLAAQAATLPLVLLAFGRLALVAPAINLVVVPLVPPAMAAGILAGAGGAIALSGGPDWAAAALAFPGWAILTAVIEAVRFAAHVPLASVDLQPPAQIVGAGLALALLWVVPRSIGGIGRLRAGATGASGGRTASVVADPRHGSARGPGASARWTRIVAIGLTVATVAAGVAAAQRPTGHPTVTVLDVGQGDAILIEGGGGGRLLVDGGPDPDRLLVTLDARLPPWDRRIDAIVLTHPHEDHVAGLVLLLARYTVGAVFATPMIGPGPGYAAWEAGLAGTSITRGILATGARLRVDDVRLRVLWPDAGSVPEQPPDTGTGINNVSIVLLGEAAGKRFLLTGDVEEGVDPELVRRGLPTVDLLKVAHHGSRTASSEAFLDAVRPTIAIASAGAGNRYGHPAPATLERLAEVARRVYRTDRDGSVSVSFEADGLRVRTAGPRTAASSVVAAAPSAARPALDTASSPSSVDAARFSCAIPGSVVASVRIGPPVGLLYHRADDGPGIPRRAPRPVHTGSTPRPALGRRRLRAGRGDRRHPVGDGPCARGRAGAVADPGRRRIRRGDHRPADRTPGDRIDVRCRNARGRRGDRAAREACRGP